jgi:hypothetical protein
MKYLRNQTPGTLASVNPQPSDNFKIRFSQLHDTEWARPLVIPSLVILNTKELG